MNFHMEQGLEKCLKVSPYDLNSTDKQFIFFFNFVVKSLLTLLTGDELSGVYSSPAMAFRHLSLTHLLLLRHLLVPQVQVCTLDGVGPHQT